MGRLEKQIIAGALGLVGILLSIVVFKGLQPRGVAEADTFVPGPTDYPDLVAATALLVQDPIASLIAPRAGKYFIHIRQQLFKAGRWIYYRAHVGGFQRPLIAYPLGGRAGATTRLRLLGDPGGTTQQVVTLPEKPGDFTMFPGPKREQPPSGLPLRVSSYPNVLEKPDQVTPVQALPAALNGIIARPGQQDVFRFSVDKKKRYRVRVFARGLGSPLDTRIWLAS